MKRLRETIWMMGLLLAALPLFAYVPDMPTYDGQSRPIAQTNAIGNGRSWNYDAAGNLLTRTDENGDMIEYSFDEMNRIDGIEYPDATAAGFTYDESGNLLAATNADAAVSFGYDAMNRVAAVTQSVLSVFSVVNYTHDKNGNRTSLTLPGNKTITYTYDDANCHAGTPHHATSIRAIEPILSPIKKER